MQTGTIPLLSVLVHKVVAGLVEVFEKTTVPVGRAVPAVKARVTVAVKFTAWLTAEGLGDDTRLVVVAAALTP